MGIDDGDVFTDWETEFESHWKPLLQTRGRWDKAKIRNELHDLVFMCRQLGKVYCHIPNNKLSKPMYYADTVMRAHDDAIEDAVRDRLEMLSEDAAEQGQCPTTDRRFA